MISQLVNHRMKEVDMNELDGNSLDVIKLNIEKLKDEYQSFTDRIIMTNALQILKQFGIDEVVSV